MATVEMSDDELQRGVMAARLAAVRAEQDAAAQSSPTVRQTFERVAAGYRALAERFDRARRAK